MGVTPFIYDTRVMHKRLSPRENEFAYRVYYLWMPVAALDNIYNHVMRRGRFGLMSFTHADHGWRDGRDSRDWLNASLQQHGLEHLQADMLDQAGGGWWLLCLPRILGYVFNPVSFWCAVNKDGELLAVVAEVNNTFGESHSYLLTHADGRPIAPDDWLLADKQFHVSPFLEIKGQYRFRFNLRNAFTEGGAAGFFIDHYEDEANKTLITAMTGRMAPYKNVTLLKRFCQIPFVTLQIILLIHKQAFHLWRKKIVYHTKPTPPSQASTHWPQAAPDQKDGDV